MSEQAQSQPQAKRGHPYRVAAIFTLAAATAIGGYFTHEAGGVLLIGHGHPEAGKKLIETIGSGQASLDAQLSAEVSANRARDEHGIIPFLLDHGAIPDGGAIGRAIANNRPDILKQLLDADDHLSRVYVESAINKDGTVEMLEVLKAHGAVFEGRLLADAAKEAPQLVEWVFANGTYTDRDIDNAIAAASDTGNEEASRYLRAQRESAEKGKGAVRPQALTLTPR